MGIPYSRQINSAFSQVTPLVASGYQVLETTKNIAVALFALEILSVILLTLILISLLALLFTLNPDLEAERKELVTPFMKALAGWMRGANAIPVWVAWVLVVGFVGAGLGFGGWVYWMRVVEDARIGWETDGEGEGEEVGEGGGRDVANLRDGKTVQ